MRFFTEVLYPGQIPWAPQTTVRPVEQPRSPGLHVSDIYVNMCKDLRLMKTWDNSDDPWDTSPSIMHLGFAWEEYILNRSNIRGEEGYLTVCRPGELDPKLSNGKPVYETPDAHTYGVTWIEDAVQPGEWKTGRSGLHGTRVFCIDDAKYTLKKPFTVELPAHWMFQACGYLHGYKAVLGIETVCFRFFVVHAAGNYLARRKDPEQRKGATNLPIFHVYWLTFTPREIEENWKLMDQYGCQNYDRLLRVQEESREAAWRNVQAPEAIREDLVLPDPFAAFE